MDTILERNFHKIKVRLLIVWNSMPECPEHGPRRAIDTDDWNFKMIETLQQFHVA